MLLSVVLPVAGLKRRPRTIDHYLALNVVQPVFHDLLNLMFCTKPERSTFDSTMPYAQLEIPTRQNSEPSR